MTLTDQDVYCLHIVDISVLLKLFSHLRPDLCDRHVEGVHLLNLGSLYAASAPVPLSCRNGIAVLLVAILDMMSGPVGGRLPRLPLPIVSRCIQLDECSTNRHVSSARDKLGSCEPSWRFGGHMYSRGGELQGRC
jgi:hypothetical protein